MSQKDDWTLQLLGEIEQFRLKHGRNAPLTRLFKAANVAFGGFWQWTNGTYGPSRATAKKLRDAMQYFEVHGAFPLSPNNSMQLSNETLREYVKKYMNRKNMSITELQKEVNKYVEDGQLSYGPVFDFIRKGSNPHQRTYDAFFTMLQNNGFISRLGLPVDPALNPSPKPAAVEAPKEEPGMTEQEAMKSLGLGGLNETSIEALQNQREAANVIAMIATSPLIKETTKNKLLNELFPKAFPALK